MARCAGAVQSPPMNQPVRDTILPALAAGMLAFSAVAVGMLMTAAGLRVSALSSENLPYYAVAIIALAIRIGVPRREWRHGTAMVEGAEYVVAMIATMLLGAVASYPVAALTQGYHDQALNRVDRALGFDWVGWYRVVAASPVLQFLGTTAYRSIYVTPAVLLLWFAAAGQRAEAYRLIVAFQIAAVLTLAGYAFMPAVGPFSYLWHGAAPYMPESETWQAGLIPALRAHAVGTIDLAHLRGLVSAPSFHAAAAVLFIGTAWRAGRLRWPLIAVNAAMLLATPVEGTHYLIDLILGVAVAGVALAATDALARIEFGLLRKTAKAAITGN